MSDPHFVYITYITTTPEKLWRALTESEFTQHYWFGTQVRTTWELGSAIELLFANGESADQGVVLEFDPPRRLSYTWHVQFHEAFRGEGPSRVAFELEPLGDVVRLTVTHDQFPTDSKVLPAISQGWPKVVSSLKSLLEGVGPLRAASIEQLQAARQEAIAKAERKPAALAIGQQPDYQFTSYIATTPEKLWQALTDGDITRQYFFGRRMQSDWKVGSPWKMVMEDGRTDSHGIVLESDPPRRLLISWRVEWLEEYRKLPEARVTFDIAPTDDGVRLILSEYHDPSLPAKYKEGGKQGWPMILSGLKSVLETGTPMPAFKMPGPPA